MSRRHWELPWEDYLATLKPHERPVLPGSPATPDHTTPWRLAYAFVGVLVALTGSLGNAAVTADLPQLAGALGVTTTEAAWLPVVFVMTNACMNLLLVKFRMQYGLRLFTEIILVVFLATAAAHLVSAFTLNPMKLWKPISIALVMIAVGAFIDSHATVLTRPTQLYFSQALLAFAAAFFIGPTMILGFGQVLQGGGKNMVSFIVLFSIGQNVGGLMGSALVGTIQTLREKFHSSQLSESISLGDPETVLRLQQLGGAYAHVIGDAAQRQGAALRLLQQQVSQQAQVLAYNDVFLLISGAAAIGAAWVALNHYRPKLEALCARRRDAAEASQAPAPSAE